MDHRARRPELQLTDGDAEFIRVGTAKRPLIDAAAQAVSSGSLAALHDALGRYLNAYAMSDFDPRDVMVGLAIFFDASQRLGADPPAVFGTAARTTTPELAELVRTFGARKDVTLGAFGWSFDDGASTPRYVPVE